MNFCFSFLDDEGATKSQVFVRVVGFKTLPHGSDQAVLPSSPFDPHLYDLVQADVEKRLRGVEHSQQYHHHFGWSLNFLLMCVQSRLH